MAEKKEYTASRKVLDAEAAVQQQKAAKPGDYVSAYEAPLKQAMERILNREDFHYNLDGDALYRRYRNQAIRNGRLAMADAAGQAAALTGGYGNSYAQSVGQQAYNRQLDSLADRIPELYNLAMSQYQLQTQNLRQKYDLLSGAQQQEYGRYQDALAAWQKEADQLWQAYTDARDSDYDAYRDEIADWQWQEEFDEDKRRYDQQWKVDHPELFITGVDWGSAGWSGTGGSSGGKVTVKKQQPQTASKQNTGSDSIKKSTSSSFLSKLWNLLK